MVLHVTELDREGKGVTLIFFRVIHVISHDLLAVKTIQNNGKRNL